ncbi:pentapeptide repeat-containing protein [Serratia ureilytica]
MSGGRFSESHIELTMFNDCRLEQGDFSRLALNQSHWMSCQLAGANFSATQHDRTLLRKPARRRCVESGAVISCHVLPIKPP